MIRTKGKKDATQRAIEIQTRRFKSGKRGVAKAVRRLMKRQCDFPPDINVVQSAICVQTFKSQFAHIVRWETDGAKKAA